MTRTSVAVVGGGIVGVAAARRLQTLYPCLSVHVYEKESRLAAHQSGHNSGVIHAGVYYTPGSLRAKLCVKGGRMAYAFLEEKKIPYNRCGKLIVATDEKELAGLKRLLERGKANGVRDLQWCDQAQLRAHEPHCRGVAALYSPYTGIVDWAEVTRELAAELVSAGGAVHCEHEVVGFTSPGVASTPSDRAKDAADIDRYRTGVQLLFKGRPPVVVDYVICCGGIYADRLALAAGGDPAVLPRMCPVRGEYLVLKAAKRHLVKGNIYPVPDPQLPFLGVHFTPRMDGALWLGPNAVFALGREAYTWGDLNIRDVWDAVRYPGVRRLALRHLGYAVDELYRSLVRSAQVKRLQRYIPDIGEDDVEDGPSGVRAQALAADGEMVDDFVFDSGPAHARHPRLLHVVNAPSPGATSALAIAEVIEERARQQFRLDGV